MAKCTCQPLREARHLQGCELDYRSGFWGCPCPALLVHCPGSVFETDLQSNLNFSSCSAGPSFPGAAVSACKGCMGTGQVTMLQASELQHLADRGDVAP